MGVTAFSEQIDDLRRKESVNSLGESELCLCILIMARKGMHWVFEANERLDG